MFVGMRSKSGQFIEHEVLDDLLVETWLLEERINRIARAMRQPVEKKVGGTGLNNKNMAPIEPA